MLRIGLALKILLPVPPVSLFNRQPDKRESELLEPSVFYSLHYNYMEALYSKHHDIESFFGRFVNFSLVQKLDALHFSAALQHHKSLMATPPNYIQGVQLGMTASNPGITQEALSSRFDFLTNVKNNPALCSHLCGNKLHKYEYYSLGSSIFNGCHISCSGHLQINFL